MRNIAASHSWAILYCWYSIESICKLIYRRLFLSPVGHFFLHPFIETIDLDAKVIARRKQCNDPGKFILVTT